jgi:hypothetical protein
LVNQILTQLQLDRHTEIDINGVYRWDARHETAVHNWMRKHIGTAKQLIDFSAHTWQRKDYKGTLVTTNKVNEYINALELLNSETGDPVTEYNCREELLVKRAWQIEFEKPSERCRAWRDI